MLEQPPARGPLPRILRPLYFGAAACSGFALACAPSSAPAVAPAPSAGERVEDASGYRLRYVPAGSYTVGCTAGQGPDCNADDKPARAVTLSRAVLFGETEVTQELYQRLMGSNPSASTACGGTCPVAKLSWVEAVRLANKLSAAAGLEACYVDGPKAVTWPKGLDCRGYRLPTEVEWEVAARGGADTMFAGGNALDALGWYADNSGGTPHPVGQKQANGYGLYDMSGNVSEWVWDLYDKHAYTTGAPTDPTGPLTGDGRGFRGGSWRYDASFALVASRSVIPADWSNPDLGLRLVRTAP